MVRTVEGRGRDTKKASYAMIGSFQGSLKFWYSHESVSRMSTLFFMCVAAGKEDWEEVPYAVVLLPTL
jgi:hypothetical protein